MELNTNIDSGDVKIKRSEDGKETTVTKEPDLVTRVSKVEDKEVDVPEGEKPLEDKGFDFKELDDIKDPEAKAWAEKAYKSFQADYTRKSQDLAERRKQVEEREVQKVEPTTWTPERLQQEINKPDFINAAQSIVQPQDEEISNLSDAEKGKIHQLERELLSLKQQSTTVVKQAEDERLKGRYANYNNNAVDTLTADLIQGKVQATREHLWKVLDYEAAVNRAYKLGLDDKKLGDVDKITSMSTEGSTVQATEGALPKTEGETDKQWFVRNALNRLTRGSGQTRK